MPSLDRPKNGGEESHLFTVDSSHVATNGDDWYTPRWIFDAAGITFDMDVASPMDPEMQHVPARRYVTAVEDGLATDWVGSIWCNPPYSGSTPGLRSGPLTTGRGCFSSRPSSPAGWARCSTPPTP